jgi:hypothetical protein
MTEIPSISSYNNQIDLNTIKNSKLFQKFMQNKTGLVNNINNLSDNKNVSNNKSSII